VKFSRKILKNQEKKPNRGKSNKKQVLWKKAKKAKQSLLY